MGALPLLGTRCSDVSEDVPLIDAIQAVLQLQLTTDSLSPMREVIRLSHLFPSLRPHVLAVQHQMRLEAEHRVRSVAGDRYHATYVPLLFGALYGMVSAALEGSVDVRLPGDVDVSPDSIDFDQFLDVAFHHLRTGF